MSAVRITCKTCGKRYPDDGGGLCPRCGAFNQPARSRETGAAEQKAAEESRPGRDQMSVKKKPDKGESASDGALAFGLDVAANLVGELAVDLLGDLLD